jgi:hypothetical protein
MDDGLVLISITVILVIALIAILIAVYACRGGTFESALASSNGDKSALSLTKSNNPALAKHKAKAKVASDVKTPTNITHLTADDSSKRSKPSMTSVDDGNSNTSTDSQARRRSATNQSEHLTRRTSSSAKNCANESHSTIKARKTGRHKGLCSQDCIQCFRDNEC